MHYYQRNLGDYARDAGHLTALQHGIYTLLLDWYYANERPIPPDRAAKIARSSQEETQAVLEEFFTLDDLGWRQARADREIHKYEQNAARAREHGKLGGRPPKNQSGSVENPTLTQALANQEPRTKNHIKESTLRVDVGTDVPTCIPVAKVVELYHAKLPSLPRVEKLTKTRTGYIQQRWREDLPTLDQWGNYFDFVSQSDFLMGRSPAREGRPPFRADLEWLTRPQNFAKVAEEKYHG